MKQYKIINAYKIIQDIEKKDKEYPLTISHAIFKVKRALQDQWDFQIAEEQKIFAKYHPKQLEDGRFQVDSEELGAEWMDKLTQLSNMDVDIDYSKPQIRITDDVGLTVREVDALSDFVDFIE